jgi:hypothetical protein
MSIQTPAQAVSVKRAEVVGEKVGRSKGFEVLARSGFVARGVVYGVIGILAVKLAVGAGGKTTNQNGALQTIAQQPFGKVLLVLVAVGLAAYALWRVLHALLGRGPERSDSGFDRLAAFASGVAYSAICAVAVGILVGSGGGHSSDNPNKATAGVFGWPAGTWMVGIAGAVFVGVAFYQGYRGISRDFLNDSKTEEMGSGLMRWITWIGTFGHLARMVVFGLVGIFLITAAIDYNPDKAVGLDGALSKLDQRSYGPVLLGIVATGLVAFALYSLSDARYRRI